MLMLSFGLGKPYRIKLILRGKIIKYMWIFLLNTLQKRLLITGTNPPLPFVIYWWWYCVD